MLAMSEFPCGPVNHTETLPLRASNRHMKLKNFACTRPLTVTFEPDYENQQSIIQYAGEFHEGDCLLIDASVIFNFRNFTLIVNLNSRSNTHV